MDQAALERSRLWPQQSRLAVATPSVPAFGHLEPSGHRQSRRGALVLGV